MSSKLPDGPNGLETTSSKKAYSVSVYVNAYGHDLAVNVIMLNRIFVAMVMLPILTDQSASVILSISVKLALGFFFRKLIYCLVYKAAVRG